MRANGYRLLGFTVWHGARWYLRRRLPSARRVATVGALAVAGAAGVAAASRRNGED